jgi:hypothetical protein
MLQNYDIGLRSSRYYMAAFFFILGVAIVNSYALYVLACRQHKVRKQLTHSEFREILAIELARDLAPHICSPTLQNKVRSLQSAACQPVSRGEPTAATGATPTTRDTGEPTTDADNSPEDVCAELALFYCPARRFLLTFVVRPMVFVTELVARYG